MKKSLLFKEVHAVIASVRRDVIKGVSVINKSKKFKITKNLSNGKLIISLKKGL